MHLVDLMQPAGSAGLRLLAHLARRARDAGERTLNAAALRRHATATEQNQLDALVVACRQRTDPSVVHDGDVLRLLGDALAVVVLDPRHLAWLEAHDLAALAQARAALAAAGYRTGPASSPIGGGDGDDHQ